MAYNQQLAARVRVVLSGHPVEERHMFGGVAFMVNGHMTLGVSGEELMVRLNPEHHDLALDRPGARPMDFTGRPMKGFVFVSPQALQDDAALAAWAQDSLAWTQSLGPKKPKAPAKARPRGV